VLFKTLVNTANFHIEYGHCAVFLQSEKQIQYYKYADVKEKKAVILDRCVILKIFTWMLTASNRL